MRAAKGDGVTDDTDAFRDAYDFVKRRFQQHGAWYPDAFYVYIPNGEYKVSDTLIYRGDTLQQPKGIWNGNYDIRYLRFVGQSRKGTVIRLADNAPGFGDPAHPKALMAFQHPDTIFNNLPGGNYLRNVTLNTGRGNPGAAALYFQGANQTDLRNLRVTSEDGRGRYGIWFHIGSVQGYYADITVEGFDVGIRDDVNPEGDVAFEYLTLRHQREAAILLAGGGMSLRQVWSDQGSRDVPALRLEGSGMQAVVLDSTLKGGKGGPAIEMRSADRQCLFARDVTTQGYGTAIRKSGATATRGPAVKEYVSSPAVGVSPDDADQSLRLPIEDTPSVPWFDPLKDWAVVDDYPSVQAAFDSGKPVVAFKKRQYTLGGDVRVPATVRFVHGMGARVENGAFVIGQAARQPVLFQDSSTPVRVEARRDVILRCAGGGLSNPKGLPVTFYLENVNDVATGDDFCRPGQRIFARQIDVEYTGGNQIVCNGGQFWIFGFKTENGAATPFTLKNGGALEILGGYANTTNMPSPEHQNPLVRVEAGRLSATLFTNLGTPFKRVVDDRSGGAARTVESSAFPARGGDYAGDISVPLVVSGVRSTRQAKSVRPAAGLHGR